MRTRHLEFMSRLDASQRCVASHDIFRFSNRTVNLPLETRTLDILHTAPSVENSAVVAEEDRWMLELSRKFSGDELINMFDFLAANETLLDSILSV